MKRIFLASAALIGTVMSAQAADMAMKAPYYKAPVVAVYNWTGFYMGVNAGAGIGRDRTTHFYNGASIYDSPQGGFGGGQIGYNWQGDSLLGPIVYGLEADIQGGDISGGGANLVGPTGSRTGYSTKSDWFGTVRGRIGLATGPVMSYFTGGYAYGNIKSSVTEGGVTAFSQNKTEGGWTIGSGVEAALGGNWTGKIEYLYLNLGNRANAFGAPFTPQYTNNELRENLFRVGLNYRIGGVAPYAPVVASNWTGWYLGGNVGSGTGRSPTTLGAPGVAPESFSLNPDGVAGGGQIGYNWQANNWVYGLEADIQASSQRDNKTAVGLGLVNYDAKLPWFGTVRGRLGYSVGSTLFYATGGYAYGGVKTKISALGVELANSTTTKSGWTAGAGIETPFKLLGLFGPQWTTTTEYLYVDLGTANTAVLGGAAVSSSKVTEHIFRTGLNYHFNTPVVAKY